MKKFLVLLGLYSATCAYYATVFAQPFQAPGAITTGLLAWYEGKTFDFNSQVWNPRYGNVPLQPFTAINTTFGQTTMGNVQNQIVVKMEHKGLRAKLLPDNPDGQYTVFAVSNRITNFPTPYKVFTWGFGGQSSYPGFTQNVYSSFAEPDNLNKFHFGTSRNETFVPPNEAFNASKFKISSLSFAFGYDQRNIPRIASVNGKFEQMDAGNVLPSNNGWVYINANAAFPPGTQSAQGSTWQHHDFAEFIVYNRILSQAERDRINTYLAIKYSLPLETGTVNGSTYTIDGVTSLWDHTQGFNTDVVGIGRHTASDLHAKYAYGSLADVFLTTKGEGISPVSNDNTFLLIGDKGTYHDYANDQNTITIPGGKRLKRIWRVQNIGVIDSVMLRTASYNIPDGARTLDPCSSDRILLSTDSTFNSFTATKLTPALIYGTTTPPLFSSYDITTKFPQGESYFTYAAINSPGTPFTGAGNTDSKQFNNCPDDLGFYYFTDAQQRPVMGIKGLTSAQIKNYQVKMAIQMNSNTYVAGNAKMMKRLLSVSSLPFPSGTKATIRFYLKEEELLESKISGGTDIWFKKQGATPDQTVSDFSADGQLATGTYSVLNGIRGSQNGIQYVEFADLESFSTFGFISSNSPLPVKLSSFSGNLQEQEALLNWQTSSETNADYFEIQRSSDAKIWKEIGMVKAAGTVQATNSYLFPDKDIPEGISYYRLKMIDKDDTYGLSRMISVQNDKGNGIILYPNPSGGKMFRLKDLSGQQRKLSQIFLRDATGKILRTFDQNLWSELKVGELPQGNYTVIIKMENGASIVKKLVITDR